MRVLPALLGLVLMTAPAMAIARPPSVPSPVAIDAEVARVMAGTGAQGLAVAVIDGGQVRYVQAYGKRNAAGDPLTPDTILYGASLTKAVFAWTVLQLADEGRVDLDRSIATDLPKPLTDYADPEERYAPWNTLAGDERWRKITPRILLTHSAGFANFSWLETRVNPGDLYAGGMTDDVFTTQPRLEGAVYPVSNAPGLGIEIDEKALTREAFRFWEAPHLKRRDGSVTNW